MQKKYFYAFTLHVLLFFFSNNLFAQQSVGIGTTTPDYSSMLDITSSSKGLLIPRLTTAQRAAIDSPANGLMLYDTNTKGFWFFNGTSWTTLAVKESKPRSIYIPANGMGYTPNANIAISQFGLNLSTTAGQVSFIMPKPIDWDSTQAFTITIHFSLPSNTTNTIINWRLAAASTMVNTIEVLANSGWDSHNNYITEDAPALNAYASTFGNVAKSQSWTAKWSSTYNTWYFGIGVNTGNNFSFNPMWRFGFIRGSSVSNGETYPGSITINGATISYMAK